MFDVSWIDGTLFAVATLAVMCIVGERLVNRRLRHLRDELIRRRLEEDAR